MAATLYIHAKTVNNSEHEVEVDLETLLLLKVYILCDIGNINLEIIQKNDLVEPIFRTKCCNFRLGQNDCNTNDLVSYVKLPALIQDIQGSKSIVAGICSVARQLIKCSADETVQYLLGFRESCLAACSESSIWTKFCEVDMVNTVRCDLIDVSQNGVVANQLNDCEKQNGDGKQTNNAKQNGVGKITLPDDLVRFEYHMQHPVRMHNVYKVARQAQNDKTIKSTVPVSELKIPHCYSEGPAMTLSDVILLPSIITLMRRYSEEVFKVHLPLTYQWIEKMREFKAFATLVNFNNITDGNITIVRNIVDPLEIGINIDVKQESLYSSDPNRYKPTNRIYTKQTGLEEALTIIDTSDIAIKQNAIEPFGSEIVFDWETIPMMLRPEGGALPKKRSKRKEEQLESLAKAVIKITQERELSSGVKIVDFCSGSGHLGLLLAHLLPKCTIFLVENKEKSLERALVRIKALNLSNVIVIQSNLDYFQGVFDIGVSLHACGVATDLVMQNCIGNGAHFVCCPCCYGGIHDCYHLKFPRSAQFASGVQVGEYMKIAHAADQTHDKQNAKTPQGYRCMDLIDSDRSLYAEGWGYDVFLGKLMPESCTPKNNLLVGLCNRRS